MPSDLNAGALLETKEQDGLAHFLEHMSFNGTKNFPKKDIISLLEKYGVSFGRNINAYTTQNETVYNISEVPTNIPELLDTCLLILHDWVYYLALEEEEIDAERGVITEEDEEAGVLGTQGGEFNRSDRPFRIFSGPECGNESSFQRSRNGG